MQCIYCSGDTQVVNSRPQKRTNSVWRRRQCKQCNTVFTSVEHADLSASIVVRKPKAKETPVEPFSRDKLLLSIHDSLRHRKSALEDAEGLTDTIIKQVITRTQDAGVDVAIIIEVSLAVLTRFDNVAATHYRAFHLDK